jgi:hypothetical protein
MKRRPVIAAPAPAYPHRVRARSLALGLLAMGATTVSCAPLLACGDLRPAAQPVDNTVMGDMPAPPHATDDTGEDQGAKATPEVQAMPTPGEAPKQPPCIIPEATEGGDPTAAPEQHEPRIRGDIVAPAPPEVEAQPETIPEVPPDVRIAGGMTPPEEPITVDGDVPHIEGDIVVPEPDLGVGPEDNVPIPGGMPAPRLPVPTPPSPEPDADAETSE